MGVGGGGRREGTRSEGGETAEGKKRGGRLLSDGRGARDGKRGEERKRERVSARENTAGVRGDSIMMQRWRGGGTLELARALAIGRSANHSFGNNRLHTLHTKDTREPAKNCLEWGCSLGPSVVHLRYRPRRKEYRSFTLSESRRRTILFFFFPKPGQLREDLAPAGPRVCKFRHGILVYTLYQSMAGYVVLIFVRPTGRTCFPRNCPQLFSSPFKLPSYRWSHGNIRGITREGTCVGETRAQARIASFRTHINRESVRRKLDRKLRHGAFLERYQSTGDDDDDNDDDEDSRS